MKQMVLLKDDFRDTALHLSACQGEVGVVKLLLARGADVDAENNLGSTPLNRAAVAGRTEVRAAQPKNNATDGLYTVDISYTARFFDNGGLHSLAGAAENA